MVTISRRYAAGKCADAQNAPRKRGDRTAPYSDRALSTSCEHNSSEFRPSMCARSTATRLLAH